MSQIFNMKELRWAVYSFVERSDETKQGFKAVLQEMTAKHVFNKQVLPRLLKGTRKVIRDNVNGPCANCYHYGPYESAGSVRGKCMNHVYNEFSGEEEYWLTYKEFCKNTHPSLRFQTYEEYEMECKIRLQKKKPSGYFFFLVQR